MIAILASLLAILAGLGLQFAMVIGVIVPDLLLAFIGYGAVLGGMAIPLRNATRRSPSGSKPSHRRGRGS